MILLQPHPWNPTPTSRRKQSRSVAVRSKNPRSAGEAAVDVEKPNGGWNKNTTAWQFFVTFLGWLSDPFKWLSDLQLGDEKVTLNHLVQNYPSSHNHGSVENGMSAKRIVTFKFG